MRYVGFTGTRYGMTDVQRRAVEHLLHTLRAKGARELHHGDCIGADAQACSDARVLGFKLVAYPPTNPVSRAWIMSDRYLEPKEYLARNKNIVEQTDILIAASHTIVEMVRSGTWSTVRYSRKKNKPRIIVLPDGSSLIEGAI